MKFLVSVLLCLIVFQSFGQNKVLVKKNKYLYSFDGKLYAFEELGSVYELHEPALKRYKSGRNHKKISKILGWSGLGLFVGGIVVGVSGIESAFSNSTSTIEAGLAMMVLAIPVELTAIVFRIIAGSKLRKARKIFNLEMLERHGYRSEAYLSFGTTPNGLGLVLTF
ncbi:MAG: hypothetical protein AAGA77_17205 [Bacteroidota bacterium]